MTDGHRARAAYRNAWLSALAGFLLVAATAQADTRDDVLAFMNHYLDSFDSQSSRYIASLHHAPMYLLAPHGVLTEFETPEKIRRTVRRWKRTLNYNGYDHTEWVSVNAQPMSDDTALVSTVFKRIKNTGELLHRGAATYTLLRQDGAWKIFLMHVHEPERALGFDQGASEQAVQN